MKNKINLCIDDGSLQLNEVVKYLRNAGFNRDLTNYDCKIFGDFFIAHGYYYNEKTKLEKEQRIVLFTNRNDLVRVIVDTDTISDKGFILTRIKDDTMNPPSMWRRTSERVMTEFDYSDDEVNVIRGVQTSENFECSIIRQISKKYPECRSIDEIFKKDPTAVVEGIKLKKNNTSITSLVGEVKKYDKQLSKRMAK